MQHRVSDTDRAGERKGAERSYPVQRHQYRVITVRTVRKTHIWPGKKGKILVTVHFIISTSFYSKNGRLPYHR